MRVKACFKFKFGIVSFNCPKYIFTEYMLGTCFSVEGHSQLEQTHVVNQDYDNLSFDNNLLTALLLWKLYTVRGTNIALQFGVQISFGMNGCFSVSGRWSSLSSTIDARRALAGNRLLCSYWSRNGQRLLLIFKQPYASDVFIGGIRDAQNVIGRPIVIIEIQMELSKMKFSG